MSENKYISDQTSNNEYYEGGLLNSQNLLRASAIAAGSLLAYKSGALSPIIKQIMKTGAEHKPTLSVAFNDLRKWFQSDGEEEVNKSIFRLGPWNTTKEVVRDFAKRDKEAAKEVIKHTKEDIRAYTIRLDRTLTKLMKDTSDQVIDNTYVNTQLLREMREAKNASGFYTSRFKDAKDSMLSKMYNHVIDSNIQTEEMAKKSLKRTGYRKAELQDMFKVNIEDGKAKLYAKTRFNFDEKAEGDINSAREQIESMLNSFAVSEHGTPVVQGGKKLRMHELNNNFNHMSIDDSIHIDGKGNMIDLRNRRAQNIESFRNLATEWQIPLIRINPLQLVGVDKIGRRSVKFATVSENTLAPALTGVYGRSEEHTIAALKNSTEHLKDVQEGITIINGDAYRISDDMKGITKMGYKSKKNITSIPKNQDYGTSFLNRKENAQRKMFGLTKTEFEEFTPEDFQGKMGKYRHFKSTIGKVLDLGHQESKNINEAFELEGLYNPDGYIEKMFKKIRPVTTKGSKRVSTFSGISDFNDKPKDSFFITNQSMGGKELITNFNKNNVKRYFRQYGADFSKHYEDVNSKTFGSYFITERLNGLMSSVGLGLSLNSLRSPVGNVKSLILKRFLPIYGGYQAWNFINMFGEKDTDGGKKPGNLEQHMVSGYVKMDIGFHNLGDKLGISKFFKGLSQLTPGSEMIGELPGVNLFKPTQTAEERAKYWKDGYDPIRKGRYWIMNSETPFIGSKISYWRPNVYRRTLADAKYSDSLYGSRRERFAHMLNPNYYDVKNYNTRPYLLTSPAFENVPIVGPILSGTVGRIISPQKRMHAEYWNKDGVKSPSQIQQEEMQWNWAVSQSQMQYNSQRSAQVSQQVQFNSQRDLGYIITLKDLSAQTIVEQNQRSFIDNLNVAKIFGFAKPAPIADPLTTSKYNDGTFNSSLVAAVSQPYGMKQIYRTNSGAMSVISINGDFARLDKNKINNDQLRIGQVMSVNENDTAKESPLLSNAVLKDIKFGNPENPNSLANTLKNQYKNAGDVAGIYGFITTDFITGTPGAGKSMIETSGYSRSFNKAFYDQDLGGLSGDISEVFRRLVQKRRNDQNYYNPIRNTMPNWMPGGKDGFADFLHGDPYTKIAHGEERLTGEGYERMNGMDMPTLLKMKSGSSTIGKTKDEIIKHFLHQDEITDPELMKIVNKGTQLHAQIEKKLLDSGVAIDTEVEMKDEKNGIIGYYDARIHDNTSLSGEAIVDIKTVGAKKLEKIRKSEKPVDYHQRQVNWYLNQTNKNSKGYIYYVDREDPTNNYTVGFGYSDKMYKSTMDTLHQARQDVGEMLHKGMVSRGDLYDPIDRLRVLADVAPYSKEFKLMNKQISNSSLSQADMDKVKAIRDRVSEQRKQTNFYAYRFKGNGVVEETGKIERQINNQTFKVEGSDTPIKLAGLKLNKTDNKHYKEAMDFLTEHMGEGKNVKILVAEDSTQRSNGDFLHSTKATVISDGMNINRELIKRGWAKEKEDDFSAAGVQARFSGIQRTFGKAWETIAHLNTGVNTKALQVRTASEDYERKQVYGKDFKSWTHPIKDFVIPSMWSNMNRSAAVGIGFGAFGGYLLGRTPYGRALGAVGGALTVAGAKMYKSAYEAHTGERWVPEEKRKQRDLIDYMDKISFVKNRRLFEVYADKALKEDHFDVRKSITDQRMQGARRKAKARKIEDVKKQYKLNGELKTGDFEKAGVEFNWQDKMPSFIRGLLVGDNKKNYEDTYNRIMDFGKSEKKEAMHEAADHYSHSRLREVFNRLTDFISGKKDEKIYAKDLDYDRSHRRTSIKRQWEALKKSFTTSVDSSEKHKTKALEKTVNDSIDDKKTNHKVFAIPKNAMKAIEYYNASEATMQGYDPGEPLTNFMAALPKKDKDYFREFLKAPESDRKNILEIAPKYMRRALQSAYKMPIDPKESLDSYFSKHALPDSDWDGWQENFDMKALKVKMVQSQGQGSLQSNDLWADDKIKADAYGPMALPNMSYKSKNIQEAKNQLENVLGKAGYKNLNFSFKFGASTPSVNLDVYQNKKDQYDNKLKERLGIQ